MVAPAMLTDFILFQNDLITNTQVDKIVTL